MYKVFFMLKIEISIIYLNHNIRLNSIYENDYIKELSEKFFNNFFILKWNFNGNEFALQKRARKKRYDLLTSKCKQLNIYTTDSKHKNKTCRGNTSAF